MTYVVAELSGNHAGKIGNALDLIEAAEAAGADAVKFQCFEPERLAEKRSRNPEVVKLANGVPLIDLYRQIHTPKEWFPELIECAERGGLDWFSSVFDPVDVTFLETLDCPRYKISAFEMLDWELIRAVKETRKPIVLSVRPSEGLTILQATTYEGKLLPLGLSIHGDRVPDPRAPMVEWHLRLPGVDTPDSEFSLTPRQLERSISLLRRCTV